MISLIGVKGEHRGGKHTDAHNQNQKDTDEAFQISHSFYSSLTWISKLYEKWINGRELNDAGSFEDASQIANLD